MMGDTLLFRGVDCAMLKPRLPHRFSIADYDRMIDTGILTENDPVELIRGEILSKMPIGSSHSACVRRLIKRLVLLLGDQAIVSAQDPVRFSDSEPEPDISVLKPREDFYESSKPVPDDVLLLIEVSDSSLEFDRVVKGELYAEAGIPEYWIVNLGEDCVEIHRGPKLDGTWLDVRTARRGDSFELAALPGMTVAIVDAIG
jgi:Uma2 family endonuclease